MKKLVLFFAVVSAVAFASCGGKQQAQQEEATPVAEETYVVEEAAVEVTPDSMIIEEAPVAEGEVVEVAE